VSEFKGTAGEWRADKNRVFFGEHPIELRSVHDANLVAESKNLLKALVLIKDMLVEINPNNYDENEVIAMNEASIKACHIALKAITKATGAA